jgi:hypothetical protein
MGHVCFSESGLARSMLMWTGSSFQIFSWWTLKLTRSMLMLRSGLGCQKHQTKEPWLLLLVSNPESAFIWLRACSEFRMSSSMIMWITYFVQAFLEKSRKWEAEYVMSRAGFHHETHGRNPSDPLCKTESHPLHARACTVDINYIGTV